MLPLSERLKLLNEHLSEMTSEQLEGELGLSSVKSEDKGITLSDIHMIRQYVNLDEGFEDIAPKYFKAEVDICLSFHLSQLKYHRESVEKWLERLEGELYDQLDKE